MKKNNKKPSYGFGEFLQTVSPLLGLIPGAGAIAAPVANIAGGMIAQSQQGQGLPALPRQQNTNPYGYAEGGVLNQTGPNTQEVIGNNPSQTDGVELPQAYVDHGETISDTPQGKYVFSDILKNPLTGNTFATDDKKLASSDKAASKKPYDVEAQNTLKINEKMRQQLATVNDITRGLTDLNKMCKGGYMKGMANGGYMKPSYENGGLTYQTGYQAPWAGFNIGEFQQYAGLKGDNIYGPKTHEALMGTAGRQYAALNNYLWDNDSQSYLNKSGVSVPDMGTNPLTVDQYLSLKEPSMFRDYSTAMNPMSNTDPNIGPAAPLQRLASGDLSHTIKPRTSPFVDPYSNATTANPTTVNVDDLTDGIGNKGNFLQDNLGTGLQLASLLGKGIGIAKRPEKQNLYLNNAPITNQTYDPSSALNRSQYSFNALAQGINNSVGDASRMSNLQQAYANKTRNEGDIVTRYSEMNKQAQRDYEARLAQRNTENNQYRYNVDQINSQNKAARNNGIRGFLTDIGNLGAEVNNQKTNKQAVQWILQSYPDIAKYFKLNG